MENDEELIAAYLKGEENAFPLLVQRHLKPVYSFVVRFVGNKDDAEDIVQETFLKAWKNLKKYSRQNARFKTWIMRIARNASIDYLRKKKQIPFGALEGEDGEEWFAENVQDESQLPDEIAAHKGDLQEMEQALNKLTPVHRETLLLYYSGGFTFEEAAIVSGISINTLKSRHRRAIVELRKLLVHPKS
ncbi:MAG: sigma-70 family RNA polymerase sigma factor [Candidatus Kaiserbacteria bacterium]|nr:sigma-70 family RNA polymerase sigma factor [Candidatus Kaiserbacteria bacterium]